MRPGPGISARPGLAALAVLAGLLCIAPAQAQDPPALETVGRWSLAKSRDGWHWAWLHAEGTLASPDLCHAWVDPRDTRPVDMDPVAARLDRQRYGCIMIGCFKPSVGDGVQYEVALLLYGRAPLQGAFNAKLPRELTMVFKTERGDVTVRTLADSIGGILVRQAGTRTGDSRHFVELIGEASRAAVERLAAARRVRIGPLKGRYGTRHEARLIDIGAYSFAFADARAVFANLDSRCR